MPVRRPWDSRPEESAAPGRRIFGVSAPTISSRACAAGLVLAMATAGSLTGIITSNHRHGIAQAAAVVPDPTTTDQLSSDASTTPADAGVSSPTGPGSTTAAAGLPVVAPSTPDSQGHAGVVPVPLAPRAVAGPIPTLAWQAYHNAAASSGCNLPWYLLAGIGKIESNHGRFAGARFDITGTVHPAIYGPPTAYGRAMGPMQFIPPTWASYATDGNGDGRADPQNVFDATKAAAAYLCRAGGADLSGAAAQRRAVFAYNHLDSYVADVLAFAAAYSHGASEGTVTIVPITYPKSAAKVTPTAGPTSLPTSSSSAHPSTSAAPTTSTSTTSAPTTASSPTCTVPPTSSAATTTAKSTPGPSTTGKAAAGRAAAGKATTGKAAATTAPSTTTTSKTATSKTAAATTKATSAVTTKATSTAATKVPAPSVPSTGTCAPCPTATTAAPRTTPAVTASEPAGCAVPTTSAAKTTTAKTTAAKTTTAKTTAAKTTAAKTSAARAAGATAKVMATLSAKVVPLSPAASSR